MIRKVRIFLCKCFTFRTKNLNFAHNEFFLYINMTYNFDEVIDRSQTDCTKYERIRQTLHRDDLIPLWIADMDFRTPPFILSAIRKRTEQGILGYTAPSDAYFQSICNWTQRRYSMNISADNIHYIPGIVPGICFAVNCLTDKGDRVMIQPPVYHPFRNVIEASGRTCVTNPLKLTDGRYEMDFEMLKKTLPGCKLFILCNPHNPGGTVWKHEELEQLAVLCAENGVTVISDEIHADMTFAPRKHLPFAMVNETARNLSVTFMAPSKTFNMPGVIDSYTIIFNEKLRQKFFAYLDNNDLAFGNVFAFDCVKACYSAEGEDWLEQMLAYVQANIDYTEKFLQTNCPRISCIKPEASFLVFLDNRNLNLSQPELVQFYQDGANLYLNDGTIFGMEGKGFMRLNVATPRATLSKALRQLKQAYDEAHF